MKAIELKCKDKVFIVPAEPVTPILIYCRYGYYSMDFQGWELGRLETSIPKNRFSLSIQPGDVLQVEVKELEEDLVSKLVGNEIEQIRSFPLTEEDFQQMMTKFHALEKLLQKEGII